MSGSYSPGVSTADQIVGFDTKVRLNRLDQLAVPTVDLNLNSKKITSLATPTATTDATTKAYVDSAVSVGGTYNAGAVVITGGSVNGTTVGASTAATGRFTDLTNTGKEIHTPASAQTLTASSTINSTATVQQITAASNITLTSNPQISAGTAGQELIVYNSGSNRINFADGNGLNLQGTLSLLAGNFAKFIYLGTTWHLVESNGLPIWNNLSFQNSFYSGSNDFTAFESADYTKWFGVVTLKGLFHNAGSPSSGSVVATLPTGYRPSLIKRFLCGYSNGISLGNFIDINSSGEILFYYGTGIYYENLELVSFRV